MENNIQSTSIEKIQNFTSMVEAKHVKVQSDHLNMLERAYENKIKAIKKEYDENFAALREVFARKLETVNDQTEFARSEERRVGKEC